MSFGAVGAILGAALLAPISAEAQRIIIKCSDAGCFQSCTQQLPNGNTVYYDHDTTITVQDGKTGEQIKFRCNNGKWEVVTTLQLPKFHGLALLGNIGVGAIAGFQGDLSGQQCNDSPEPVCTDVSYKVGPPGRTIGPVCDPNTVGCPF